LPVNLEQAEIRTIGATLGVNALNKAIQAGIIGVVAVLMFMLVFYRLPGLVADFALIVYILIMMIVMVSTKVTLTATRHSRYYIVPWAWLWMPMLLYLGRIKERNPFWQNIEFLIGFRFLQGLQSYIGF